MLNSHVDSYEILTIVQLPSRTHLMLSNEVRLSRPSVSTPGPQRKERRTTRFRYSGQDTVALEAF